MARVGEGVEPAARRSGSPTASAAMNPASIATKGCEPPPTAVPTARPIAIAIAPTSAETTQWSRIQVSIRR